MNLVGEMSSARMNRSDVLWSVSSFHAYMPYRGPSHQTSLSPYPFITRTEYLPSLKFQQCQHVLFPVSRSCTYIPYDYQALIYPKLNISPGQYRNDSNTSTSLLLPRQYDSSTLSSSGFCHGQCPKPRALLFMRHLGQRVSPSYLNIMWSLSGLPIV